MKAFPKLCAVLLFFVFSLLQLRADPFGLVSHWQAESNALDTLNQNNGTEHSVSYAPGVVGSAFLLNSPAYVNVANPTFNAYASGFTVMAWIKMSTYSPGAPVVNFRTPANSCGFTVEQFASKNGSLAFYLNQSGNSQAYVLVIAPGWQTNAFYHVAATFDAASGSMALYRNGVLVASTNGLPHTNMATLANNAFELGRNIVNGQTWRGLIDDVRFYDHALTPMEIAALGGGPVTLFAASQPANTVLRYQLGQFGEPVMLPSITNNFRLPSAVAISPSGELFIVNTVSAGGGKGWVSRYLNPAGTPVFNGVITNGFNTPEGATFRGEELLVVDAFNNRVRRFNFDADGAPAETSSLTNGLRSNSPRWVCASPDGNEVFVSQCCGVNEIRRFLIGAGGAITDHGAITGKGLNSPHGMAFNSAGELFVANPGANSVLRFVFSNSVAVANGQITNNGLSTPIGLTFSPWGELFAANLGATNVLRWTFTTNGTAVANGSFAVTTAVTDLAFLNSVGEIPVAPPFCTNLTFTLIPVVTNCVLSTNTVCVTNTVVLTPAPTNCYFLIQSFTNTTIIYVTNTSSTIPTNGLIAWWRGDGNALDSAGTNHGTLHGGVTYVPGHEGQAFSTGLISNNPSYVDVGTLSDLDDATGLTISTWVNVPNYTDGFTYGVGMFNQSNFRIRGCGTIFPGNLSFHTKNYPFSSVSIVFLVLPMAPEPTVTCGIYQAYSGFFPQISLLPASQWVHLVATWRSSDGLATLSLNGSPFYTTNVTAGLTIPKSFTSCAGAPSDANFRLGPAVIGGFTSNDCVSGSAVKTGQPALVDEMRIYNRALSSSEISQTYTGMVATVVTQFTTTIVTNLVTLVCPGSATGSTSSVPYCVNVTNTFCVATSQPPAAPSNFACSNSIVQVCTNVAPVFSTEAQCTTTIMTNCNTSAAVVTNLSFCSESPSKLMILRAAANTVNLRWPSQTNAYYLLQGSDELGPLVWTNLWGIGPGTGSNLNVIEPTATRPKRFYRLLSTEP